VSSSYCRCRGLPTQTTNYLLYITSDQAMGSDQVESPIAVDHQSQTNLKAITSCGMALCSPHGKAPDQMRLSATDYRFEHRWPKQSVLKWLPASPSRAGSVL